MLLYFSPMFLEHETGGHPENGSRIVPAMRFLNQFALHFGCERPDWQEATREQLERVHSPEYLTTVQNLAEQGGGSLDEETVVSPRSYHVACLAAGAFCDAVRRVVGGEALRAFCLVRPPGHHALPDSAMGFCLVNNVAIGARTATAELGIERVLIVDWDAHHGNGTQAIFWEDPQVAYYSIHRAGIFPESGLAAETGAGTGLGTTLNVPLEAGTPRQQFLEVFTRTLTQFAASFRPQLVLISAGFDGHRADPVASLGLEYEDFATLTRIVLDVAKTHAEGRVISVLEGGYSPTIVAECVEQHVHELLNA